MVHPPKAADCGPVELRHDSHASMRPLRRAAVRLSPAGFLGSWQVLNSSATIPHCIEQLELSGALDNLRRVVGESEADYVGFQFADSDVYKVLEAIAWDVDAAGAGVHEAFVSDTIALLARVQQDDGYLNSYVQGVKPAEKLTELRWSHELYCLGHLIQAAVARVRTTGRDDLLEIAIRFADLVNQELGENGRADVDGHPEIETALVELYRTTQDERYLALARRFIDLRGHGIVGEDRLGLEYFQDHTPVGEVAEATGHAVRQLYLTAGVTDIVLEHEDELLSSALQRIWRSVHEEKMYVSGGLGSRHRDESFGDPYELPSDRAYSETCAAIANFMWNWRMLLLRGESRFADEMERGLYNAIAVSTSQHGTEFFYSNPLHLREGHRSDEDAPSERLGWYACACCPPNLARLIASLSSYVASQADSAFQLDLYADASIQLIAGDGSSVAGTVRTQYPWDGRIDIEFDETVVGTDLRLRLPGWAGSYQLLVDGEPTTPVVDKGYLIIDGSQGYRRIEFELPTSPVIVSPHPRIDAVRGCVAIARGPVLYCLEQLDLPEGVSVHEVEIPRQPVLSVGDTNVELGTPTVTVAGARATSSSGTELYTIRSDTHAVRDVGGLSAIPYFRWANRRQGAMRVWIPTYQD